MNSSIYLDLEEYFSLEDYSFYKSQNFNESSEIVKNSSVRVSFPDGKKNIELIVNKNNLKKVFAFFKIYFLENNNKKSYINLLVKKNEAGNYNGNNLLNKINHMKCLKGAFCTYLKIKEFPLVNKFLEEHEKDNNDNDTDKIFYIKNNDKLYNMNKSQYYIYGDSCLKNSTSNTLNCKTKIILYNINYNNSVDKKLSSSTYQNNIIKNFYKNS